jgi:para-nitrobenzyl esterase
MKDLGLASNDIQSLQKMGWSKLFAAGNAAAAKINPPVAPLGPGAPGKPRVGWSPCVDGKVINTRSFFDAAPEVSKDVPMLIGSVSEEGNQMSSRPNEQEWQASLAQTYGEEKATAMVAALKKAYPNKKVQTLSYMCSGRPGLEQGTGNTPEAQTLAKRMASSWAAFAATGKPSIPGIAWEPSDPETNKTMLWDNDCRMVNDPEGEARKIILS